jgi:hypothetical protein
MAERRSLSEGLRETPSVDKSLEELFVFGKTAVPAQPKIGTLPRPGAAPADAPVQPASTVSNVAVRVPLTSRVRPEIANALKRMSLERRLAGREPNTVQEIIENALDAWLSQQPDAPPELTTHAAPR